MSHRQRLHENLRACATELLAFVRDAESAHPDRWVPTVKVKEALALNLLAVPRASKQYGEKGWLFAILARMLEEEGLLEYCKSGSRSYCRTADI